MQNPERRFDEAEVAAIFERATAREASGGRQLVPSGNQGLTLAQLQDIGREIGVAPQDIADAAAALARPEKVATRRFLGLPVGVERTVHLPRRLSEEEWERLVVALRETFDARGVVRQEGSLRQWRNGNLQALLEPTDDGQRVRLRTYKGNAPGLMTAGLGLFGVAATAITAAVMRSDPEMVTRFAVMAAGGAGLLGVTAASLFPWARRRREQMAEIAARIASLARSEPRESRPAIAPPPDA